MAVGMVAAEANEDLTALSTEFSWVKLHIGDPGAAGTANAATETDRQQASWDTVAGGVLTTDADLVWTTVAGSEDYTHFSVWDASSAGNFGWSGTVTANAVTTNDTFTIPAGDLTTTLNVAA